MLVFSFVFKLLIGEEQGREIQKVAKSACNGLDGAANQFSEDAKDGMDWIGQKLGIDYDRVNENGKTYREINEENKNKFIEDQKKLENDSPDKNVYNGVKDQFYDDLNKLALLQSAHSLP